MRKNLHFAMTACHMPLSNRNRGSVAFCKGLALSQQPGQPVPDRKRALAAGCPALRSPDYLRLTLRPAYRQLAIE
jgi:hypothetical protein